MEPFENIELYNLMCGKFMRCMSNLDAGCPATGEHTLAQNNYSANCMDKMASIALSNISSAGLTGDSVSVKSI